LAVVGSLLLLIGIVGVAFRSYWETRRDAAAVRRAVEARRFTDAPAPLARWLERRPDDAEAHYYKARVAFGFSRSAEVSAELDRALALGYPEREIDRYRGFLLVLHRRYVEAEPYLVRVLAGSSRPDPEADEALARVFLQTYKLNLAARVLQRWMHDAPADPRPYLWATEIDRRTQADPKVTIEHFRQALRLDPNSRAALLGLADELRKASRHDEAGVQYDAFMARFPEDAEGYVGAGRLAIDQNDLDRATRLLDRALALDPRNRTALDDRASIEQRRGRFGTALEFLNRAISLDPADPKLLYSRGIVLTRLGRRAEGEADLRKHKTLEHDSAELNHLREHLNEDPNNIDYRFGIARWMIEHGQYDAGVKWAKLILAAHPNHAPTNRLLADYYQGRGESGLANFYRLQAESGAGLVPHTIDGHRDDAQRAR
jgi:tetratricopeptide (TPR) repeat protein